MTQTIQFASSLSLESDLKKAALEVGDEIAVYALQMLN